MLHAEGASLLPAQLVDALRHALHARDEADAAAATCHIVERALAGQPLEDCYLASDCEPVRLDEVVAWVREQLPCAKPGPDARKGGRAGSKRCDNQRLLDSGFRFRYPDFRVGYQEMIAEKTR